MVEREKAKQTLLSIDCSDDPELKEAIDRAIWSMNNAHILRNELCMKCGAHEWVDGCNHCRWKEDEVH